jgi:monoamine oxidase
MRAIAADPLVAAELTAMAADYGATPAELALSALDEEDSLPGPQRVFPGGFGQLAELLADGLQIRLNTTVTSISLRDPQRVAVRAADRVWNASAVILTVPLGVLKAGAIVVDPPLPPVTRQAIGALGFGRYEKLVLRFDSPCWDDVDQSVVVDAPFFRDWYNLHRVTGEPVLMGLNGAGAAVSLDGLSVDRQAAAGADVLRGVYGPRFTPPLAALASAWGADPLSRGSYSFTAPGSGPGDRTALGDPVDGRPWLAGEACHPTLHSTVHGAYASGRLAAEQACG